MKTNNIEVSSRDNFGSRFGVLVAMAGSAIGLGNLWRFPYLMGENGGAAFIIIYLVFVFVLCLPIMFSEFILGRRSQSNVFGAFRVLAPGSKWGIIGIFGVLASICILSFYSVVGGWSIEYLVKAVLFDFTRAGSEANHATMFSDFVSSPVKPLLYHLAFMALTAFVVLAGIKKGIEKYTKMMMPMLFVMVIIIAIRSLTLEGAGAGVSYMFKPDFSKVTSGTFLAALGQAFFSLSLGCGTIMTYGSYVSKDENIMKCSAYTSIADTLFAIIAGCAIMPAVFAFGISPGEGPGLVFITLPRIFASLPLGGVIAILFFVTLLLAALTSSISLLEVFVSYLIEEFKMKRGGAVAIAFGIILLLGCFCSLSQGAMSGVKLFGMNIFDLFDYVSSNVLMPIGGLLIVIFVGWRLGKTAAFDELTNHGTLKIPQWLLETVFFIIRFVAPVTIAVIMIF
ncbi:MAG: sodium-dependent transporter [Bacteroidales bacterium]|nr:sodium-dependent transporter [Bacteroidales bacterium]MDD4670606.1 sodium-dependent transporter [Bacteroidales bacterium]